MYVKLHSSFVNTVINVRNVQNNMWCVQLYFIPDGTLKLSYRRETASASAAHAMSWVCGGLFNYHFRAIRPMILPNLPMKVF